VHHHIVVSVAIGEVVTERDPEIGEARNAELRNGDTPPPPADPTLTTGILLRDADGELSVQAGELALQGWVHHQGRTGRFDDVVGWGFALVALDADPLELLDDQQRAFLDSIHCRCVGVSTREPTGLALDVYWAYDRWFEHHGVAAFLMRPDFYLFGTVASTPEIPAMVDALREQLHLAGAPQAATPTAAGR
jgi:hypothetical protein